MATNKIAAVQEAHHLRAIIRAQDRMLNHLRARLQQERQARQALKREMAELLGVFPPISR